MRYLLVDMNHLVNRAVHVVHGVVSKPEWAARSMMIILASMRKHFDRFESEHIVACFDSYSWREALYAEYKDNRKIEPNSHKHEAKTLTHELLDDLSLFMREETNVTTLEASGVEADDFIARWTQLLQDDEHVIVSGDSDFRQLVKENVDLFDTHTKTLYTVGGVFYMDVKRRAEDAEACLYSPMRTASLGMWSVRGDLAFDPGFELFSKCMKGDPRDNIKPAFRRIGETKLRAAWADRGGLLWNSMINGQDGPPADRREVRPRYDMNRTLIDLTQQPAEVKQRMDDVIEAETSTMPLQLVHPSFLRFCDRWGMRKMRDDAGQIVDMLSRTYK